MKFLPYRSFFSALLLGLSLFSSAANADYLGTRRTASWDSPENSIYGDAYGPMRKELTTAFSSGGYRSQSGSSELNLAASILYVIQPKIQIGGEGSILITSGSGRSSTDIKAFFVGAYSFENRMTDSFYFKAGIGLVSRSASGSNTGASTSDTGFFLGFGKRITLWQHLSYSPEFRYNQFKGTSNNIEIHALNFSIFF